MTEQDLVQIKQTFSTLDIDDYFIEGEDYGTVYMKFKELRVFKVKLEIRETTYTSLIEDSSDGYIQIPIYKSTNLKDLLVQTKLKLAELLLSMYNQVN